MIKFAIGVLVGYGGPAVFKQVYPYVAAKIKSYLKKKKGKR